MEIHLSKQIHTQFKKVEWNPKQWCPNMKFKHEHELVNMDGYDERNSDLNQGGYTFYGIN